MSSKTHSLGTSGNEKQDVLFSCLSLVHNGMGTLTWNLDLDKEIHSKDFCIRGRDQIFAEFGAEFENSAQYSADCRI